MKTLIKILLIIGLNTMALAQVEKTDSFEVQRQKINDIAVTVDSINDIQNLPGSTQYVKEDFFYHNSFQSDFGGPSIYFKYRAVEGGPTPASSGNISTGIMTVTGVVSDPTDTVKSELRSNYIIQRNVAGESHYTEALFSLYSPSGGFENPAMETSFGFSNNLASLDTAPSASIVAKSFVGFLMGYGAAELTPGQTPTVQAVVYNNQSPTPSQIFAVDVSSHVNGDIYDNQEYNKFGVYIDKDKAMFYVNGTLVATFTSTFFNTGIVYQSTLRNDIFSEDDFIGYGVIEVDYIAIQSKLVR